MTRSPQPRRILRLRGRLARALQALHRGRQDCRGQPPQSVGSSKQRPRAATPQATGQQGHPGGDVGKPLRREPPARIARAGFRGRRGEGRDGCSPAPRVGRRLQGGGHQFRFLGECGSVDGRRREGHEVVDAPFSGNVPPGRLVTEKETEGSLGDLATQNEANARCIHNSSDLHFFAEPESHDAIRFRRSEKL